MRTGLGVFAGAGVKGTFGAGPLGYDSGDSNEFSEGALDIGKGPSGRFRVRGIKIPAAGLSGGDGGGGFGVGPGVGASAGADWGYKTIIWCSGGNPCKPK